MYPELSLEVSQPACKGKQGRQRMWMLCFASMKKLSITSWTWQSLRGLDREFLMLSHSPDARLFFS